MSAVNELEIPDEFMLDVNELAYATSLGYLSCARCPVAMALRRMFPEQDIAVGGDDADINDVTYRFDGEFVLKEIHAGRLFSVKLTKKLARGKKNDNSC